MRNLIIVLMLIALSSCASFKEKAMDPQSVADIKGQSVALTTREKPAFMAVTAGKAAFAMIGAFAMISEGNKIIADNNVEDPANDIAAELIKELSGAYGVKMVTPAVMVDDDDIGQVAATIGGSAEFVVDVQTISWSFEYFPTDWTHYQVGYSAKARLINVQTEAIAAEGYCQHIPESNVNAPTYDELIDNEAAGLKSELSKIAGECAELIKSQMLSI